MTTYEHTPRSDAAFWFGIFIVCVVAMLASGCRSVAIVAEPSAVVEAVPDTIIARGPSPLPKARVATMPVEVREYRAPDTSQAAPVTAVIIDRRDPARQTYTIRTPTGSQTGRLPATGEVVVTEARADSTFGMRVGGEQVAVVAPEREPTWWEQQTRGLACVGALCILALLSFVALRLR